MKIWSNHPYPFEIEDLIETTPVILDEKLIKRQVQDKTIIVTGAAGSIGNEIVRQLIPFHPKKILLFDQPEYSFRGN
ncbi:MAG: polysaccharide biosynthesis protein [Bacteroidota bacterium]